jgi:hypothetical protein
VVLCDRRLVANGDVTVVVTARLLELWAPAVVRKACAGGHEIFTIPRMPGDVGFILITAITQTPADVQLLTSVT